MRSFGVTTNFKSYLGTCIDLDSKWWSHRITKWWSHQKLCPYIYIYDKAYSKHNSCLKWSHTGGLMGPLTYATTKNHKKQILILIMYKCRYPVAVIIYYTSYFKVRYAKKRQRRSNWLLKRSRHVWMFKPYMSFEISFQFCFVWAIWTFELRLLAALIFLMSI